MDDAHEERFQQHEALIARLAFLLDAQSDNAVGRKENTMSFSPPKSVQCCPKDMDSYSLFCELTWGPETTPDVIEMFWCAPCGIPFAEQDEVRPQRCPACDVAAKWSHYEFIP